ncbi:MAG: hypothetical protein AAF743_08710 [Planctomycetota bacterium]
MVFHVERLNCWQLGRVVLTTLGVAYLMFVHVEDRVAQVPWSVGLQATLALSGLLIIATTLLGEAFTRADLGIVRLIWIVMGIYTSDVIRREQIRRRLAATAHVEENRSRRS